MKNFLLLILLSILTVTSYSQNKTLGVGVAVPNPNAALHVESPTANQGFIMPRLSTAQRTAMTLTPSDNGLMVYDTDLKANYIWDGATWANAAKLTLPAAVALTTADLSSAGAGLYIEYSGTDARQLLSLNFSNAANPNVSNPLSVTHAGQGAAAVVTQSGTLGTGGIFHVSNAASTSDALRGLNTGAGTAVRAVIANAASTAPALFATTNGSGNGIFGQNTGTGNGFAGFFQNTIATNTFPAVQGTTAGMGSVFRAIQTTGPGAGMDIFMQNATGTAVGFIVNQTGLGAAANFNINNATNNISTINANTNGTGNGGYFAINNAASGADGVFATTNGTGTAIQGNTSTGFAAVYGRREGATNGNAGRFEIADAANSFPALQVNTIGTGSAGNFEINNAASGAAGLYATTNGTGAAISANNDGTGFGIYARATGATDAIYAEKQASDASGSAGNFWNFNSANAASALFASTNAATGTALGLINSADGNALVVFQGGLKISNLTVSTPGAIAAKAGLYEISTAGSYTLPVSGSVGETCWVANTSAGLVTINAGPTVATGTVRQFIRLSGGWQIVN